MPVGGVRLWEGRYGDDSSHHTINAVEDRVNDGKSTRSEDKGSQTVFQKDDRIGLIVLNKDRNLMADNVPYVFDGNKWDFDSVDNHGKERVYYDAAMSEYIVYYPYDPSADGCKTVKKIHELPVFDHREDQSTAEAYLYSDPMAWSVNDGPEKHLNVQLKHLRNSFTINPKVRWILTTGETIHYQPLRNALEGMTIYDKDKNSLKTFQAADSTYRYILPDNYSGGVDWEFRYRDMPYYGTGEVAPDVQGVRYVHENTMERGNFDDKEWKVLDFFCSKDLSNQTTFGYVIPWDAGKLLNEQRCIGLLIYLGKQNLDKSVYPKERIADNMHGYVVALTNTGAEKRKWLLTAPLSKYDFDPYYDGYSGYRNTLVLLENTDYSTETAAYSCYTYGNESWQDGLRAPDNASQWYLPSAAQNRIINSVLGPKVISRYKDIIKFSDKSKFGYVNQICTEYSNTDEANCWTSTAYFTIGVGTTQNKYIPSLYY